MQLIVFTVLLYWICQVTSNPTTETEWKLFKQQYTKHYDTTEDKYRRTIWEDNKRYTEKHNSEAAAGLHTYTMGLNSYSDMKHEEFVKIMMGLKISANPIPGKPFVPTVEVGRLPDTMNWTALGYVTEVGNQGQCGSCWAFSVIGALEGQWFRAQRKLVRLSVQDLMDCSKSVGNQGCEGGFIDKSYKFIRDNHGIDTWKSYPYDAKNEKCRFNNDTIGATCRGYTDIKKGNEDDLYVAVGSIGPVAVAIDAYQESFSMYKSGVYDEPKCTTTRLSHTLLVTGYGKYKGKEYWLAKNSWGTSWGMNGYIMMSRNKDNQCGIASLASYPLV
ncbi:procathepsin L-like [Mytilus californianus]|uniref:procathepsin L-like n=1 Tax=Mytilus californianus TaxID=6549 RepID=UPI002247FEFF|nr:procathepsin L-like [Mytilus californianus]